MTIDINELRADKGGDPEKVRDSERRRFRKPGLVDEVIDLDKQWVKAKYDGEQLVKKKNDVQKQITERKKKDPKDKCEDLMKAKDAAQVEADAKAKAADELLVKR